MWGRQTALPTPSVPLISTVSLDEAQTYREGVAPRAKAYFASLPHSKLT
jgi:hypothetical protein